MRKCIVEWFEDHDGTPRWRCGEYFMSRGVEFRETSERCYHHKCPGRQERAAKLCAVESCANHATESDAPYCSAKCRKSVSGLCKNAGCENPIAPPKQNHCSERCRNQDNNRAYRARRRGHV